MKKLTAVLINLIILLIVLCSYKAVTEVKDASPDSDTEEILTIDVVYEEDLDPEIVEEVRKALGTMPPEVLRRLDAEGLMIMIRSEESYERERHINSDMRNK